MPRQRSTRAAVIRDTRIGGDTSSRQHGGGSVTQLLDDVPQRLLRRRRHGSIADHPRNGAQCRAVSEFYCFVMESHDNLVYCRHYYARDRESVVEGTIAEGGGA